MKEQALIGCLLGTAVGDALGLPYEGMTASRGGRMFPDRDRFHFLPGYGMVSDDTEHACFTAQALFASRGDQGLFERELARSLRWWLVGMPAGIGYATLRSVIRLCVGIPPSRSGVLSAGNGPAMRSPIIGVAFGHDRERLRELVLRSTRMTHSGPTAYFGALTAAVAAHVSASGTAVEPQALPEVLAEYLTGRGSDECVRLVEQACSSADRGETVQVFAASIGSRNGVSGYILHTVPCVVQAWLRHQKDYAGGIREIISAGGDTDTAAAILGGILGAGVGREGIPVRWQERMIDWPRSVTWMEELAAALGKAVDGDPAARMPGYFVPGLAARNAVFLLTVLAHGARRMFPPYR